VKELNLESSIAGIISSAILIAGILGGPLFGFVSDILKKRRTILILLTSAMAIDFIIVPFSGYYLAIFNSFLIGAISAGVFSIMYAVPSLDNSIPNELIPLALGILNSFQIAIGSLIPYVFSFIADNFSFFYAWIFLAIYAIATLPILKMLTVH
ncbi:MAG: MFS transporter, partial [Thermoproteota archaeon]